MLMDKNNSILLVIDVQENLTPVQESPREVINGCTTLLEVAGELNIPCVIAEQDHKVFGQTMIDLRRGFEKKNKTVSFLNLTLPAKKKGVESGGGGVF